MASLLTIVLSSTSVWAASGEGKLKSLTPSRVFVSGSEGCSILLLNKDANQDQSGRRPPFTKPPGKDHVQGPPNFAEGLLLRGEKAQAQVFPLRDIVKLITRYFDGSEELRWLIYFLSGHIVIDDNGKLFKDYSAHFGQQVEMPAQIRWADAAIQEQYNWIFDRVKDIWSPIFATTGNRQRAFNAAYETLRERVGDHLVLYPWIGVRGNRANGCPPGDPWMHFENALRNTRKQEPLYSKEEIKQSHQSYYSEPRTPAEEDEAAWEQALSEQIKQAFKTLGLEPKATYSEMKQAYRKMVLITHPDQNIEPGAAHAFMEVQAAREFLEANVFMDDVGPGKK